MKLELPFEIGQTVWVIDGRGKAHSFPIYSIDIHIGRTGTEIRCMEEIPGSYPGEPPHYIPYSSRSVFKSEDSLISLLMETE